LILLLQKRGEAKEKGIMPPYRVIALSGINDRFERNDRSLWVERLIGLGGTTDRIHRNMHLYPSFVPYFRQFFVEYWALRLTLVIRLKNRMSVYLIFSVKAMNIEFCKSSVSSSINWMYGHPVSWKVGWKLI
jgi:hypothetical protein